MLVDQWTLQQQERPNITHKNYYLRCQAIVLSISRDSIIMCHSLPLAVETDDLLAVITAGVSLGAIVVVV